MEMLSEGCPLLEAASLRKLRLVRLLVEGGANVNKRNAEGETALIIACKGEFEIPKRLQMIKFLLENQADPNIRDKRGRTALMYTCIGKAGAKVATQILKHGADPSMEDSTGASALVYAINAQDEETLKVLLDACKARGRDVIIISKDITASGLSVTKHYLNVPPSPDYDGRISSMSCMSPSAIQIKTVAPRSGEMKGEPIFYFNAIAGRCALENLCAAETASPSVKNCRMDSQKNTPEENVKVYPKRSDSPFKSKNIHLQRRTLLSKGHSMDALVGVSADTSTVSFRAPIIRLQRKSSFDKLPSSTKKLSFNRGNTLPVDQDKDFLQLPSLLSGGRRPIIRDKFYSDSNLPSCSIPETLEMGQLNKEPKTHMISAHSLNSLSRETLTRHVVIRGDSTCNRKTGMKEMHNQVSMRSECGARILPLSNLKESKVQYFSAIQTKVSIGGPHPPPPPSTKSSKLNELRMKKLLRRHSIPVEQITCDEEILNL